MPRKVRMATGRARSTPLGPASWCVQSPFGPCEASRSEEHTSELQSQSNLVCRLLLEKKKKQKESSQYPVHYIAVIPRERASRVLDLVPQTAGGPRPAWSPARRCYTRFHTGSRPLLMP